MRMYGYELARQGSRRLTALNEKDSHRSVIIRGRALDLIAFSQLTIKNSIQMVDTDGAFFFVPGVSVVGGDDKVRP